MTRRPIAKCFLFFIATFLILTAYYSLSFVYFPPELKDNGDYVIAGMMGYAIPGYSFVLAVILTILFAASGPSLRFVCKLTRRITNACNSKSKFKR